MLKGKRQTNLQLSAALVLLSAQDSLGINSWHTLVDSQSTALHQTAAADQQNQISTVSSCGFRQQILCDGDTESVRDAFGAAAYRR